MARTVVAFWSRAGENHVAGSIEWLEVGNTAVAAGIVADVTGGELHEIRQAEPYPDGYRDCVAAAVADFKAQARPALLDEPPALAPGDDLYLAYPCYCGTMPMAVWTFLESCSTSGVRIHPLCTNEGSGMGTSEADVRRLCPEAEVLAGLPVTGHEAAECRPAVERWLAETAR